MRVSDHIIDINENDIASWGQGILDTLIKDRTTGGNIIWATDVYEKAGISGYGFDDQIMVDKIVGEENYRVVRPRVRKTKEEQEYRSHDKAEVFTPAWVCNHQNNQIDALWFEGESPFNTEKGTSWETNYEKITFPESKGKTWFDYVKDIRLEVACGEAPYVASRFDVTNERKIPVKDRIGILDRKLRIVSENTPNEASDYNKEKWRLAALRAVASTYGFEWQGDNLLLAREAVLLTYIEFYKEKWGELPKVTSLKKIAEIISWNFWQMDGLTFGIPGQDPKESLSDELFERNVNPEERYCRIRSWNSIKPLDGPEITFKTLTENNQ